MRRVVPSREVYHLWANQAQPEAHNSSSSVSFNGVTAYSYRAPIARLVQQGSVWAVLFNTQRYSVTTAKHQAYCRGSVPPDVQVFNVPDIGGGWSSESPSHVTNLQHYANTVANLQGKAKRARKYGEYYAQDAANLMQEANAYCLFFGIAGQFDSAILAQLVEAQRIAREERASKDREEQAKYEAEERERLAVDVPRWLAGERVSLFGHPDTLLRIDPFVDDMTGDLRVETSRGARVPLAHAKRLYRLLQARDVHKGERVGGYTVERVDTDALQIGCHYITLAEVERFAATQGWNTEPVRALTEPEVRAMFAAQDN